MAQSWEETSIAMGCPVERDIPLLAGETGRSEGLSGLERSRVLAERWVWPGRSLLLSGVPVHTWLSCQHLKWVLGLATLGAPPCVILTGPAASLGTAYPPHP